MSTMFHRRRPYAIALTAALAITAAAGLHGQARGEGKDEATAARKMAPPVDNDPKVPFEKYTLENGLEVILIQDSKTPVVFVSVWYHVGSGDETLGKSGFAHLFEHMMFQGTANTGEDKHFEILKTVGASNLNGTTSTDRTNYFEQVPSHQLETALWLESERMGYLLPTVTKKSLDNQIEVVRNERRQSYDNQPYGLSGIRLTEELYPEGHPYKYDVIGRHEDLAAASADDVKNFFKRWYVPGNATLTLAGDFEPAEAKKLIEKWFGGFPKSAKPAHKPVAMPTLPKTKRIVMEDKLAKLRRVHYAWHTPGRFTQEDAELDLLGDALGASGTGRLYRALVIDRPLARSVRVQQSSGQLSSTFDIIVDLNPDADLAEVEKIINAELVKAFQEPISDRELKRSLVGIEAGFIWGLESVAARAEVLQGYNHYIGNPDWISQDLNRYRGTNPAKVQATAAAFLKKNRVEVITMPAGGK